MDLVWCAREGLLLLSAQRITPRLCKSCVSAAWAGSTLVHVPPATWLDGRRRAGVLHRQWRPQQWVQSELKARSKLQLGALLLVQNSSWH
jgi:hypothetical protein